MGVRLREYLMARRSSRRAYTLPASQTQVQGFAEFEARLNKLGDFPNEMKKELRAANHRIGKVAVRVLKNRMPSKGTEFVVYERGAKGIGKKGTGVINRIIPAGTLKRSIRTWNAKGSKINVNVGPRGRRGAIRYDGYFAGIVEGGHVGGRDRSIGSKFYNIIRPTFKTVEPRMKRMQILMYKRIFERYVRTLKSSTKRQAMRQLAR